jgi:hypothetical protein
MLSECKENEDYVKAANCKDEFFSSESLFLFMMLILQQQKIIIIEYPDSSGKAIGLF